MKIKVYEVSNENVSDEYDTRPIYGAERFCDNHCGRGSFVSIKERTIIVEALENCFNYGPWKTKENPKDSSTAIRYKEFTVEATITWQAFEEK